MTVVQTFHSEGEDDGTWKLWNKKRGKNAGKEINILWKLLPSWICKKVAWKLSSLEAFSHSLLPSFSCISFRFYSRSRIQLNLKNLHPEVWLQNDFSRRKEEKSKSNHITLEKYFVGLVIRRLFVHFLNIK